MALRSFKNAGGSFREDETLFGGGAAGGMAEPQDGGFGLDSDDRKNDQEN